MRQSRFAAAAAGLAFALAAGAAAADLEDALEAGWRGAWVVVRGELGSACDGFATNNESAGGRIVPKGPVRFASGELARIAKVNVKRQRVDLFLELPEPVLLPQQDGPFTLYRQAQCQVQLIVPLDRAVVQDADLAAAEEVLDELLERYRDRSEATASGAYNGRVCDDYPADYQETLARHAVWQAEERNAAIARTLDDAEREAVRILDALPSDPTYLDGFAAGVHAARSWRASGCDDLIGTSPASRLSGAPSARHADTPENRQWRRGHEDGQRLTLSLALISGLRGCYVPVLPSGT